MRALRLRTLHWRKTDDSLVQLADGSWHTMADVRRLFPNFDITRSWELPDVRLLPGDEDLGSYLTRLGFNDEHLDYVRRSYANATGDSLPYISAQAALEDMVVFGKGDYRILDGYDCVFAGLADGVDIRLQTVVASVDWSGDSVRVETADGHRFEADNVVITLPLGGYSVATPGHAGARAELARPLANRLYWAGEATAPNRMAATVHGAYASGRRAASEILLNHRDTEGTENFA